MKGKLKERRREGRDREKMEGIGVRGKKGRRDELSCVLFSISIST